MIHLVLLEPKPLHFQSRTTSIGEYLDGPIDSEALCLYGIFQGHECAQGREIVDKDKVSHKSMAKPFWPFDVDEILNKPSPERIPALNSDRAHPLFHPKYI